MSTEIRNEVLKLMEQKDKIEDEIKQLTEILTQNGVGMNDSLVDDEGFPIRHMDVYQVRHARHRIICLQNDHKAIMKQIEGGLHGYYSASSGSNSNVVEDIEMKPAEHHNVIHKTPFGKVTVVSPGSPADYAGIQENDFIIEFGSVNHTNFRNIIDIANVVQHSEGQQIGIKLQRNGQYITVNLIPKKWSGKGLLGCNIIAL